MIRAFSAACGAALALSSLSLTQPMRAEEARVIDGIAAVVNGEVITYSQVRQVIAPRERLMRQQLSGEEYQKQLKAAEAQALKDLIDRELIVQSFKKEKYALPDYFVEQRMSEIIRENFGGDRNTFMKMLEAQNFSLSEFKKNEFEKIIVSAMRGKNVNPNMVASPVRIAEYYKKHREEFSSKSEVKLRMIMIPSRSAEGNSASQKALAQEILGKLKAGANFESMAQIYSEDSTRDLGGDWGWIERQTLAGALEQVAFNLPTGKVSDIVELGGNYYILKVDERRGGVTKPLAQVREEVEKRLRQEDAQRMQENWLAGLRQKATIRTF
ncbi:MAG: peptidylprolyl isomerase [Chthoniobacterales bacterium]